MPRPVLTRFDVTFLHDRASDDNAQVPLAYATIEFYGQGATTTNSSPSSVPTGSSTIVVYDPGDIALGSAVKAGVGGNNLTITAIALSASTATLTVYSPTSFTLQPHTRLIHTSNRPLAYADPLGTSSLGSNVTGDATGRVACYLNRPRFDYVVLGASAAAYDAASSHTLSSGHQLTWAHTASGNYRFLLVGISWTGHTGGESITGVTYGGVAMLPLGSNNHVDAFYLRNPPSGAQTIVVDWGGSDVVTAVGGAVSLSSVDSNAISPITAGGTGTSATSTFTATSTSSLLVSILGLGDQTAGATVSSSQTLRWNAQDGSSPHITRGAALSTATPGGSLATTFTLSASRVWGTVGLELRSVPSSRLVVDAQAGTAPSPAWVNARDFASLQDAFDSLPEDGGTLYLPPGQYTSPAGGLLISHSVTIQGAGVGDAGIRLTSVLSPYSENDHAILIASNISSVTIRDVLIFGPEAIGTGNGIHALCATDETISNILLERVDIRQMHDGIHLEAGAGESGVNLVGIKDCLTNNNSAAGIWLYGVNGGYVISGYSAGNVGYGLFAHGCPGIRILSFSVQNNQSAVTADPTYDTQIRLKGCNGFDLIGSILEGFVQAATKTALVIENCFGGIVNGCLFINGNESAGLSTRGILVIDHSRGLIIGTNTFDRTQTPVRLNASTDGISGVIVEQQVIRIHSPSPNATDRNFIPDEDIPTSGTDASAGNLVFMHSVFPAPSGSPYSALPPQYIFGILLPRVPEGVWGHADMPLQEGLLIYDSTNKALKYCHKDGGAFQWKTLTGA